MLISRALIFVAIYSHENLRIGNLLSTEVEETILTFDIFMSWFKKSCTPYIRMS